MEKVEKIGVWLVWRPSTGNARDHLNSGKRVGHRHSPGLSLGPPVGAGVRSKWGEVHAAKPGAGHARPGHADSSGTTRSHAFHRQYRSVDRLVRNTREKCGLRTETGSAVETITGVERRRRWWPEEKQRVLAELEASDVPVTEVVRRHGGTP